MSDDLQGRDLLAVKAAAFRWSTTRKPADARILADVAGDLVMENEQLRKVIADYEEAITWNTSCLSCSKMTTASYAEYVRAEEVETTIARHEDLLASLALYISWHGVTKKLTTEQKELFADSIERDAVRVHGPDGDDPDPEMAGLSSYTPRWWRPETAPDQPEENR